MLKILYKIRLLREKHIQYAWDVQIKFTPLSRHLNYFLLWGFNANQLQHFAVFNIPLWSGLNVKNNKVVINRVFFLLFKDTVSGSLGKVPLKFRGKKPGQRFKFWSLKPKIKAHGGTVCEQPISWAGGRQFRTCSWLENVCVHLCEGRCETGWMCAAVSFNCLALTFPSVTLCLVAMKQLYITQ